MKTGNVANREYGMTQEQVALVQKSFSKVASIADRAAVTFYDRLFEVATQEKACSRLTWPSVQ